MNQTKIPQARLYRRLFSRFWPERLTAYDMIASDLTERGCRLFHFHQLMPHEMDAKLLTGQIVSIYMKRFRPMRLAEFTLRMTELYDFLLQPMREEQSPQHRVAEEMLLAIYDDDDMAARQQVSDFFATKLRPELSVLENFFRCYAATMREVRERCRMVRAGGQSREATEAGHGAA